MLQTSRDGLALYDAFEGNELVGYICPAGVPTIGRGHTAAAGGIIHYKDGTTSTKVIPGKAITERESRRLRDQDVDKFEDGVLQLVKVPLEQHELDALVVFALNVGLGAFKKSTLLRKLNAGDKKAASRAFEAWNKATVKGKKVVVKGLVRRRAAEQALFDGDIEKAYAIAQTTRELPMPQSVEKPEKKESLADDGELIAGGCVAVGGAVKTAEDAGSVVERVQDVTEKVDTLAYAKDSIVNLVGDLASSPSFWIGAAIVVIGGYLMFRAYRRWRDDEVDGDEAEQVDVEDEA